jgi:hypothetical protein
MEHDILISQRSSQIIARFKFPLRFHEAEVSNLSSTPAESWNTSSCSVRVHEAIDDLVRIRQRKYSEAQASTPVLSRSSELQSRALSVSSILLAP